MARGQSSINLELSHCDSRDRAVHLDYCKGKVDALLFARPPTIELVAYYLPELKESRLLRLRWRHRRVRCKGLQVSIVRRVKAIHSRCIGAHRHLAPLFCLLQDSLFISIPIWVSLPSFYFIASIYPSIYQLLFVWFFLYAALFLPTATAANWNKTIH